ncbi:hypothetical protein FRC09_006868 [Ceratobasidium sp. 395]|nr:hypothetical protein FRC09_006868 [Ceratobasidium sp. 395]
MNTEKFKATDMKDSDVNAELEPGPSNLPFTKRGSGTVSGPPEQEGAEDDEDWRMMATRRS